MKYNIQYGDVYYQQSQSSSNPISNWIGEVDGSYIRIRNIILASNGWDEKANLYVKIKWKDWTNSFIKL